MTGPALRCFALSTLLALVACDPGGGGDRSGPGRDLGIPPGTDGGPLPTVDNGPRPDYGLSECAATTVEASEATAPVDIVWVIDNSGSMSEEADLVQSNINDFAATIAGAGLDVHVVVITAAGFVNVPPPLGTDPTQFLRVEEDVQSSNSLEKLLSTYDRYSSFLRTNANLHFVVVTDDESDMSADAFHSMMFTNLGKTFRVHAIASPPGSTHTMPPFPGTMTGCGGPHGEAADNGDIYWELASSTGGLQLSICAEDWSRLFDDLTTRIAIPQMLPCVYEIPEVPAGETFDPNRVNVEYTPGTGGTPELIPNVRTLEGCTGEGWYYDDPEDPTQVQLCPFTCRRLEDDTAGKVDVAFGCMTVII
ncbi:MAG: VWA domain-containing protein [Deltaproteobacteria bacterium]|nr:VWA domain-containing protein [Deltaproteobacteria bacterium]